MDFSTSEQFDEQPSKTIDVDATQRSKRSVGNVANLKHFQKGVSGNPGGKSKVLVEIQTLARSKSKRAFERIVELVEDPDSRVALMAAKEVLDRAYGKAKPMEDDSADKRNVTINIVRYTAEPDAGNHIAAQLEAPTVSVRTLALS